MGMNTKKRKRECAWKWVTALTVFSAIAGAGCQPDKSHIFADKMPIRILIRNAQGKPQPNVQLDGVEIISCAYGNCSGRMDLRILVSDDNGLLRANVPFPGTFDLNMVRESDKKSFTRRINATRPEQLIKVVL